MRIAFFTDAYRPTINGVVASIDLFCEELTKLGHEVTIICPTYPEVTEDEPGIVRISAVTLPTYKEYRIASPFSVKLDQHMKEHVYDIIHVHSPFSIGLAGIMYAKRYRLPVVYTAHTNYADYRHYVRGGRLVPAAAMDKLASHFSNTIDITLAPSQKIADSLAMMGTKKAIAILPTGLAAPLPGDRQRFRQKYDLQRKLVFLYLGRVTQEKNVIALLDSFHEALPHLPAQAHLVIVGDGPYRDTVEQHIQELGMNDVVTTTGVLTGQDKADAYSAADIFCHASYSETQGITLLEAAQYGLPLVVSDDSAYEGVAIADKNALLGNPATGEFAEQLVRIAADTELRKQLSRDSKQVAAEYTIQRQTAKLLDIYHETMAIRRSRVVYENGEIEV